MFFAILKTQWNMLKFLHNKPFSIGGTDANSQGMEMWHPNENKTVKVCDLLPHEVNKPIG
jgi:hypothetical protein